MTATPAKPSIVCVVCQRPVRVIEMPGQRARRLADHGRTMTELCAGSGRPVQATDKSK